jgi:hypothetical protein
MSLPRCSNRRDGRVPTSFGMLIGKDDKIV